MRRSTRRTTVPPLKRAATKIVKGVDFKAELSAESSATRNGAAMKYLEDDICFNRQLLARALRFHLQESGLPEEKFFRGLPEDQLAILVPRNTWAALDNHQRLQWLLEASNGRTRQVTRLLSRLQQLQAQCNL